MPRAVPHVRTHWLHPASSNAICDAILAQCAERKCAVRRVSILAVLNVLRAHQWRDLMRCGRGLSCAL